mgnify:CR=1 FL=1
MKKITVSDWLSLGLAGILDFLIDIKDPFGLISNYYYQTYSYIPSRFQKSNISHAVWRAIKNKRLKKKKRKDGISFSITFLEKERIKKKFPLLMVKNNQWDGIFRMVIYDIDEERKRVRDYLRRVLKRFGFGMFQKSVWISPHNFLKEVKELIEETNLTGKVIYLETKNFYVNNIKQLAEVLWPIKKLNCEYSRLYQQLLQYPLIKFRDRVKVLKELRKKIVTIYFQDPFLPQDFLPEDWKRNAVVRLIKKHKIFS